MAIGTFIISTTKGKSKVVKTGDGADVAARYFVYKLYEATDGQPMQWQVLLTTWAKARAMQHWIDRSGIVHRPIGSSRMSRTTV
jgi:hypothetical protein